MKDFNGLYYYPFPQNRRVRMYIKQMGTDICFRMWSADDKNMWDEHGWIPYQAIRQASALYSTKSGGFDPNSAYNLDLATELIREDNKHRS